MMPFHEHQEMGAILKKAYKRLLFSLDDYEEEGKTARKNSVENKAISALLKLQNKLNDVLYSDFKNKKSQVELQSVYFGD